MKSLFAISVALILLSGILRAQDTMYVHHSGGSVSKFAVVGIDSIVFNSTANMLSDIDGHVYNTIIIGAQTWMAGNLRTSRYNDGIKIPVITDISQWSDLTTGAYCWYNNDSLANENLYGKLYNWYAVNTGKLCPSGWHVPTDAEWKTLTDYLTNNGYGYEGSGNDIAKSMAAKTGWLASEVIGSVGNVQSNNNSIGFSALPGGYRSLNGAFNQILEFAYWWSVTENNSTTSWFRYLTYNALVSYRDTKSKESGFSVRCLKN